ncbi:MAG: hypothetical protein ACP5QX_07035 [Caldisericaceae bacterium]
MSELKEWLKSRKTKPRSVKELSEVFKGVPYKTVSGWVNQSKIPAKKDLKERLYEITKIDRYMPDDLKEQRIEKIKESLYMLINELDLLVESTVLRDYFRKGVNKNDIAYLSSLLEALLDEKRFQIWNAFQRVKKKGVIEDDRKDNL